MLEPIDNFFGNKNQNKLGASDSAFPSNQAFFLLHSLNSSPQGWLAEKQFG